MKPPAPFAFGSLNWPGLSKLVEEAGEVQQVAGKLMMTGGKVDHWDGTNLLRRIGEEVADLSAACRVFFMLNGLSGAPWVLSREQDKLNLFLTWHRNSLQDKPDEVTEELQEGPTRLQRFFGVGSDLHYQIYWSWRIYPAAMFHTGFLGVLVGVFLASAFWMFVR